MDDDLPYLVEYAKSDRSKCQLCKQSISKFSLRLAAVVQVRFEPYGGKTANKCASLPEYFDGFSINGELHFRDTKNTNADRPVYH